MLKHAMQHFDLSGFLLNRRVTRDAKKVLSKLKFDEKGLLIDCGSNLGQGFDYLKKFYPLNKFDYILIEPNPFCVETLSKKVKELKCSKGVEIIPKAVGTSNNKVKFYGLVEDPGGNTSTGGSILKEHNSKLYQANEEKAILVNEFSFSDFLSEKIVKYRTLIIKMDIEGGEYKVLEDLLARNIQKNISVMYVEFHSQYMSESHRSIYQDREINIVNAYKKAGIIFRLWP